jgi:hypothetical protein
LLLQQHVTPTDSSSRSERIELVMRELAQYISEHPHAMDTVTGVRDFWVPAFCGAVGTDVVQAALDALVAADVLDTGRLPGGDVIYTRGKRSGGAHQ